MATFQPMRLVQARQIRRVTARELSAAIGVSPKTVSAYETGRVAPPVATLAFIADHLHFPVGFFHRPAARPPTPVASVYFRSLRSSAADDRERVTTLGDLFHELMAEVAQVIPLRSPDIPRADTIDRTWDLAASASARGFEVIDEIATRVRRAWGLGDGPIPDMVRLLEAHGVWAQVLREEAAEIDAFSYWSDGRANIVLNHAKGDPFRSRFDAAHELGHLVMHENPGPEGKEREKEANLFASAFLLPRATWSRVAPRSTNPWHYVPLKKQWRTSVACMLYRSKTLGLIDDRRYTSAMVQYSQLGWRSRGEPLVEGAEHEEPVLFRLCVEAVGHRTMSRFLDEMLLPSDVARDVLPAPLVPSPSPPSQRGHLRVVK